MKMCPETPREKRPNRVTQSLRRSAGISDKMMINVWCFVILPVVAKPIKNPSIYTPMFHVPLEPCLVHKSFAGTLRKAKNKMINELCSALLSVTLNTHRIHRFTYPISMLLWTIVLRSIFPYSQRS